MDPSGNDMVFDMNEVLLRSHPQAQLNPSSLYAKPVNPQRPVTLGQGAHPPDERLDHSMNFLWAELDGMIPQEPCTLLQYSTISTNYNVGSIMPSAQTATQTFSAYQQNNLNFSSIQPNHDFIQSQNTPPVHDQPSDQPRPAQISISKKRAQKAPTMSAKKWEPHKERIRQIYATEGKSEAELRKIMNEELGINATLRQYKVLIKKMKLEKNVKAHEQKAVLKHIQYRKHVLRKESRKVRIRKHEKDQKTLLRWAKEDLADQPYSSARSPSPLPSGISIFTKSVCESLKQTSPVSLKKQQLIKEFMTTTDMTSTLMQRLLKYAQSPNQMIKCQEVREVFNDLQHLLSNNYTTGEKWNPSVSEDMIQVRNLMNVTPALFVSGALKDACDLVPVSQRDRDANLSNLVHRSAAWETPFGKVQATFWALSNDPNNNNQGGAAGAANKTVTSRITLIPKCVGTSSFCVIFDFTPHLDLPATITYQAIIPSDSEIFKTASAGDVEKLIDLLEKGFASLSDRDENGRSLLNYAISDSNVDMCKFLVDKKADVNAIETSKYGGDIGPVHSCSFPFEADLQKNKRDKKAQCFRIMAEAGADYSLEVDQGDGTWYSAFVEAVSYCSLAALTYTLDFGKPFVDPNGIYKNVYGECSALTILAHDCGYYFWDTIDVVSKAILLLNRNANISCRDEIGDTVLHTLLKCKRLHERLSKTQSHKSGFLHRWRLSRTAPKDLLMVFITAGADVYATNNNGETPSMVAAKYGRKEEWIEALERCGYHCEEVLTSCIERPTLKHQRSKLSFQEYCQQRPPSEYHPTTLEEREHRRRERFENESQYTDEDEGDGEEYEELQSEDSDDSQYGDETVYAGDSHEEVRVITENTENPDSVGGNVEISGGADCSDHDMDLEIGLNNESRQDIFHSEETVDHQVSGLDITTNDIEGTDVNWESFVDFGMFPDIPLEQEQEQEQVNQDFMW